jgi:hypothetical protein
MALTTSFHSLWRPLCMGLHLADFYHLSLGSKCNLAFLCSGRTHFQFAPQRMLSHKEELGSYVAPMYLFMQCIQEP